ncbi:nephrin-like protein, partial [Dinothrombium tinctorium]
SLHEQNCEFERSIRAAFTFAVNSNANSPSFAVLCQQQQYFRERPQPMVEVVEGDSLVLKCVIGNQAGAVQWSKDGFVLGYERSIPGYPSYSMVGNARDGVHNLRIENVKMEDDGQYQCQVGPALNNKAIRASSKVTVLLKPTSIDIFGHSNGSSVEIREGESLKLQCLVYGGKPSAKIKWFRKNVELRSGNVCVDLFFCVNAEVKNSRRVITCNNALHCFAEHLDLEKGGDNNANGFKGETETNGHELPVSKSTITLTPHADDNGVPYTCEADHQALTTPLRKTVTLSVLYPPGQPEISGYADGETVRMGDTLTLVCKSRGGNPLAQLVWYKNNEQVDFSYTTLSGRESINSYSFIVDASDNNAVYRCESSSHPISPKPAVASIKLNVQFAPAKVLISGPSEAKAGENVTMVCRTERSNPAAEISWVVDGRPLVAPNVITADPGGGWITTANVTVSVTNQDRNMKMFSCYAVNQALGETIVETSVLSVLYPPDPPSIFGYAEGSAIRAGTLQRITCVVHGGNPLPELKWFKQDEEVKTGTTSSINGNVVSNELAIITKDSDNGATYRCEAHTAAAASKPLVTSVKLTVLFPPTGVTIQMKPKVPKAGSKVDLICETGSSNPESEITWWRNGFPVAGRRDGVFTAPYGGTASRNILSLNVTSEDNGAIYSCQATNQALGQSVHDAITLNVLYKPEFVNSQLTQIDLVEGGSTSVNLSARGNPSKIEYKWLREGLEIDTTRFKSDGPFLNISSILRSDSGIYKCLALNEQGTTERSVIVNVQYPVSIEKITETVFVEPRKNAYFECQVNANPITKEMITWKRRKNLSSESEDAVTYEEMDAARMKQTLEANRSILIVSNVSQEDSGAFECSASNGIGDKASAVTYLVVKQRPVINRSPTISKAASENGSVGRLICRADGAPNVTFTWSREGSILSNPENRKAKSDKYVIEQTAQLNIITFQSVLLIKDVSNSDYGEYKCVARNELGFDTIDINFSRTTIPDPPIALRVINRTSNGVTLKWVPGFDGGLTQSFRIRYKKIIAADAYVYRDVYPSNITQYTVTGLDASTEYIFNVLAFNDMGESAYTEDIVKTTTLKGTARSTREERFSPVPLAEAPVSEKEKVISQVLSGKAGDIPRLIIIVVSVLGSSLLLLNIVLVVCFVRRRRKKRLEEGKY